MHTLYHAHRDGLLRSHAELPAQAAGLLARIDDDTYRRAADLFGGQRIGAHIRHVIDGYECLFDGLDDDRLDYEARRRDPVVEADADVAITKLCAIAERLQADSRLREDRTLWVAAEGTWFLSSIGRELEAVRSHTVHHFALIAMLLRHFGISVPSDFGVSSSTLRYRESIASREAA